MGSCTRPALGGAEEDRAAGPRDRDRGGRCPIERTERVLKVWSATAPQEYLEGRTLQQEIKRIDTALRTNDEKVLAEYGGFNAAMRRGADLESLPEAQVSEGVSIDEFSTYRATRFSARNGAG